MTGRDVLARAAILFGLATAAFLLAIAPEQPDSRASAQGVMGGFILASVGLAYVLFRPQTGA